nr:hypothetical protein [Parachlamydiaceae bacterium]
WTVGERRKSFPHPIMRLAEKSPLWSWAEVVNWLYHNKIISDDRAVEDALFLANINAALEECDQQTRKIRHNLLEKMGYQERHIR